MAGLWNEKRERTLREQVKKAGFTGEMSRIIQANPNTERMMLYFEYRHKSGFYGSGASETFLLTVRTKAGLIWTGRTHCGNDWSNGVSNVTEVLRALGFDVVKIDGQIIYAQRTRDGFLDGA